MLFADLVGFTGRAEAEDPEAVRAMQRAYFAAVSAPIERYGGVVEKYIGDAVMALFGIPVAHDDDAERSLHAAIDIREAVRQLGYGLEIRIGVNTGEVVGGAGPGRQASEYSVAGDAVNLAARLQQAAAPQETFVGDVTRRLAADAFEFSGPHELELKGKDLPVVAWRLLGELTERPRLRRTSAPLVGRERELATLESALQQAAGGEGAIVALVGEAGIGKSRLTLELRERAARAGFAWYWATGRSYASTLPYFLVSQLANELLARAEQQSVREALISGGVHAEPDILGRWSAVLGELLGLGADGEPPSVLTEVSPSGRQHLLVQAVNALVAARGAQHPFAIVLDDLHWTDAASLAVLDELVDAIVDLPVLLLAVYRPGWSHDWSGKSHYQQLNLGGLRADEARALSELLQPGSSATPNLSERVLGRAAGNPFFLEELLLSGAGTLEEATERRLPETVHEVLLARIDSLPTDVRRVLQLAAVVGMEFSEDVIRAADQTDDLIPALHTLQRQDLVLKRPGPAEEVTYLFRHPLIHEVAYRSLLVAHRRELHGRIARHLEATGREELIPAIAEHYRDSDNSAKALEYLPRAADRATALFAPREALSRYREAAALATDPSARAEFLTSAANQAYIAGELGTAAELVRSAIELYESQGDRLHALDRLRLLGRYRWMDGQGAEAERDIATAVDGLERLPPSMELALAYSYRSQIRMLASDYPAGVEWAERAIRAAEPLNATEVLVHALNNLGSCLNGLGDPRGMEFLRRSLTMSLEHHLHDDAGRAYTNLSGQGWQISHVPYEQADAFFLEALDHAERTNPGGVWDQWIRAGRGEFLLATARWDEAETVVAELADLVRANRYLEIETRRQRSQLASYRGQAEAAYELVADMIEPAFQIGDLQAYLPVVAALAHAQAARGEASAAADVVERAAERRGQMIEGLISTWFLFETTDVAMSLNRAGDEAGIAQLRPLAMRWLDLVVATAHPSANPAAEATRQALLVGARLCLALLADAREGEQASAADAEAGLRAARTLDEAHRYFDAARIRLWLAELGVPVPRELMKSSAAVFTRLGAVPYIRAAARLAASSRT